MESSIQGIQLRQTCSNGHRCVVNDAAIRRIHVGLPVNRTLKVCNQSSIALHLAAARRRRQGSERRGSFLPRFFQFRSRAISERCDSRVATTASPAKNQTTCETCLLPAMGCRPWLLSTRSQKGLMFSAIN